MVANLQAQAGLKSDVEPTPNVGIGREAMLHNVSRNPTILIVKALYELLRLAAKAFKEAEARM